MRMEPLAYEKEYPVHVYDTGPDGKTALFTLFNFMQDIASEHAVKLGFGRDDLLKNNNFWVLSRIYAVVNELPLWEDRITVRTWPNGTDKLFAMRNYEVLFADGRISASALSSWLIVDRTTKKIQRPGDTLSHFHSEMNKNLSPVRAAGKLTWPLVNVSRSPLFRVRVSDLDINLHTNNVNYLRWVTDTYDINFIMNHNPCSVEINYLAESVFGDEIVVLTSSDENDNNKYNHLVSRTGDNKELCRLTITWKSRQGNDNGSLNV